ncbi:MAG TPA: VIT1/CCC1 transporter family protein [Ktedonobacterales bacterium]|nr:VIT1/CCC1 transporter family protein [Ktedonobacterales bacterium]
MTVESNPTPATKELITFLQESWRREKESQRVYADLAAREHDQGRKGVLEKLAETEGRHAARWEEKLVELGAPIPEVRRSRWQGFRDWVNRQAGADATLRRMEAEEDRVTERYEAQARGLDDETATHLLKEMQREEESHSYIIRQMVKPAGPQSRLDILLHRESWHKRGGGWLGQAIYGANDGLGAVFGIVSGVAGYTGGSSAVLIAGLAGMLASALSMGSGAYLATKSQREVYQAEISREKREIEADPDEEREELSLFYQLKGFSEEEAEMLANRLSERPEQFLSTLAHEELGLSEEAFPNPALEAVSASISTGLGAFIPIIPFFFLSGYIAIIVAAGISLVAHFAVGAAKTLVTGRSWVYSGTEMTVVGAIEAVITFGLGLLFRVG